MFPRATSSYCQPLRAVFFQPYESLLRLTLLWVSPNPQTIPLSFVSLDLSRVHFQFGASQVPTQAFLSVPLWSQTPAGYYALTLSCIILLASSYRIPWPSASVEYRGSIPITCVIGERYLSPGSSRFVASPPAGFCSDVVVSLLSGWILPTRLCQLSWRTL